MRGSGLITLNTKYDELQSPSLGSWRGFGPGGKYHVSHSHWSWGPGAGAGTVEPWKANY